jgi:tRNA (guanine26-N2/guanine27-N2)-dimethyltransferase
MIMRNNYIKEGLARIGNEERIFYNPHMKMCRDISSLWVGTLPKIENLLDGFCASGIRGIRYRLENTNIEYIHHVDRSSRAITNLKKNLRLNKLNQKMNKCYAEDINRFMLTNIDYDYVELDPFGTPNPFLDCMLQNGPDNSKIKYISITATDTAVLCGAHHRACIKNYSSKPLDNEFCHENGMRILLGAIGRAASKYEWALTPQFCFSHRHYMKVLARLDRGALKALESATQSQKYLQYCPHCMFHEFLDKGFAKKSCPQCKKEIEYAGPLWGGRFADEKVADDMLRVLQLREEFMDSKKLRPFIEMIKNEAQGPRLYYDTHELASRYKVPVAKLIDIVDELRENNYFASRTHFKNVAIRTDAPINIILEAMKKRGKKLH